MATALQRASAYVWGGVRWRLVRLIGDKSVDRLAVAAARRWRPLLRKPVYVGVAGSLGKTTTKVLLMGVLACKWRGIGNGGSYRNDEEMIGKALLDLRPTHRFFVAEVSEGHPGAMDGPLALLQPGIGIVTVIGNDHWSSFGSREAIAAEVRKLVTCLPATGTAVLNADDPLVRSMAANCAGRVITYGLSPDADLRAEDIRATWPDRLQLIVARGSERVQLRTQLCGSHWVPSVLGAIGGGIAVGMTLDECAKGIANVPPFEGRMQPVTTPDGVTFIRDDFKAPLWTLDSCFEFMSAARAKRKIIVVGTLSSYGTSIESKYRAVAKRAQQIADITIFVGPWASSVLKARQAGSEERLRAFNHVRDAAEYLNSVTREGDLVLLKGTNKQDHLLRVILARTGDVACWRDDCGRHLYFCDECPDRVKPSGLAVLQRSGANSAPAAGNPLPERHVASDEQVIVGLGNPEPRYSGTPHNVGFEVVDRIAESLGLTWDAYPDAWIARGVADGRRVCLVKTRVGMNLSGGALKQLAETMAFDPKQCILVHDDLDTPLGSIRTRLSGGAGGHHGVASILEAFQTDAFRRVKVGVGQPHTKLNRVDYVLSPFAESARTAVDLAILAAELRVLELATGGLNGSRAVRRASSP